MISGHRRFAAVWYWYVLPALICRMAICLLLCAVVTEMTKRVIDLRAQYEVDVTVLVS
jgi:hypothetical protein